jgi:hypothetical protein
MTLQSIEPQLRTASLFVLQAQPRDGNLKVDLPQIARYSCARILPDVIW